MLVGMFQQAAKKGLVSRADVVQRPKRPQLHDDIRILFEHRAKLFDRLADVNAGNGTVAQFSSCLADEPFVGDVHAA